MRLGGSLTLAPINKLRASAVHVKGVSADIPSACKGYRPIRQNGLGRTLPCMVMLPVLSPSHYAILHVCIELDIATCITTCTFEDAMIVKSLILYMYVQYASLDYRD